MAGSCSQLAASGARDERVATWLAARRFAPFETSEEETRRPAVRGSCRSRSTKRANIALAAGLPGWRPRRAVLCSRRRRLGARRGRPVGGQAETYQPARRRPEVQEVGPAAWRQDQSCLQRATGKDSAPKGAGAARQGGFLSPPLGKKQVPGGSAGKRSALGSSSAARVRVLEAPRGELGDCVALARGRSLAGWTQLLAALQEPARPGGLVRVSLLGALQASKGVFVSHQRRR